MTDMPPKKTRLRAARRLFALIALGCIAAALIFAYVGYRFLSDVVPFPVHRTGDSARTSIEASGVKLPASATNLSYDFESQFSTYRDTWISFSASAADCMSAARAIARTQAPAHPGAVSTSHREACHGRHFQLPLGTECARPDEGPRISQMTRMKNGAGRAYLFGQRTWYLIHP